MATVTTNVQILKLKLIRLISISLPHFFKSIFPFIRLRYLIGSRLWNMCHVYHLSNACGPSPGSDCACRFYRIRVILVKVFHMCFCFFVQIDAKSSKATHWTHTAFLPRIERQRNGIFGRRFRCAGRFWG